MAKLYKIVTVIFIFFFHFVRAGTFTSNVASGAWNAPGSWSFVGDADGIPDADDNVTILLGHNITNTVGSKCTDLTVQGTITINSPGSLLVYGNYSVTGTEAGTNGKITFGSSFGGLTISGGGVFSSSATGVKYIFATGSSRTISAGTTITKLTPITIANTTVTNLGTVTVSSVVTNVSSAWVNSTNSTLIIRTAGFMSGQSFTASASGNTVVIGYITGSVPITTSGYYNLTLGSGSGTKTLPAATVIANKLTINTSNTLNSNGFDLSVGGDWSNSGSYTAGTRTVTFNGTSTVSGSSATNFNNVTITGTLTGHATSMNVAGNFINNGTFTHNSGTIVFNGISTIGGTSTSSFNGITITGTLTGDATTMNVAGDFTNNGTYNHNSSIIVFNGTSTLSGTSTTSFNNVTITGTVTGHATDMNILGNYVNNGTFNNNSGTVSFNGTAVQTISGTSATNFENLTINNLAGVSITSGTYILDGALTVSNGTFATGGNSFRMTSTQGKTAYIAQITGTGAITGDFIVENDLRPGAASWVDMASPVQTTTFGEWAGFLPAVSYNYTLGWEYPTQWTYDAVADDFSPVTAAATALTSGIGFEVYLSGDFNYGAFGGANVTATGVPTQGDQSIPLLGASNLVGNPFACSISWAAVSAASPGIVGFDIMDAGNYVAGGAEIPSGQGFWVYGAGTLNIPESAKTSTATDNVRSVINDPYFTLKLSSTEYNVPFTHILKVAATATASDGWNMDEDHLYRKTPVKEAPSLYTTVDGKNLIINTFNNSNETYDMPVTIKIGVSGNYKFEAIEIEQVMSEYSHVTLEDKLLNEMIDLTKQNEYSFEVTETGDNIDRFVLHFSNSEIVASTPMIVDFANHIEILPTPQGNRINFYLNETEKTTISVTNLIGQKIAESMVVDANNQSLFISLPEGYKGLYIVRVESDRGSLSKKFVKN